MKELLQKAAAHVEQAEIYVKRVEDHSVSFQASKLKEITHTSEETTTLRLLHEGKLGSSQTTKPGSEDTMLQYALNTVKYGSPVNYSFPGEAKLGEVNIYDPNVTKVSLQEMLDIGADLIAALTAYDPNIKALAGVSKSLSSTSLENTLGFFGESLQSGWSLYFGGEYTSDEGFLTIYDSIAGAFLNRDVEKLKRHIIESFRIARNIVPFKEGQYPVIFSPSEVKTLITPMVACLSGKAISRGFSPWKGRLGEPLLDPRFSLVDDALVNGAVGSKAFDREGTPTSKRALFSNGILSGYLLDLQTAAELKMAPTGNGSIMGPTVNNLILEGGSTSYLTMIEDIEEGVLIDSTMGAWAGNPYGGQVSGNISLGYKIEKGKLVGRIKDCMFSLNVFTDLRDNLVRLSSEQSWKGNFCFPHVQLGNINITTKGE
ncbi:MAG: TldD/PmbA family protein [bacterium]|nr:TldD/PmbA family protein [bacterium]